MNIHVSYAPASLLEAVGSRVDPEQAAVVCGPARRSWGELRARTGLVAALLVRHGLAGRNVGMMLHNGPEFLEVFFALSAVGGTPFSVNTRYTRSELAELYASLDGAALVYSGDMAATVREALPLLPRPPRLLLQVGGTAGAVPGAVLYQEELDRPTLEPLAPTTYSCSSEDRVISCTGGTTGPAKGVVWRVDDFFVTNCWGHDLVSDTAEPAAAAVDRALADPRRSICPAPMVHIASLAMALMAIYSGGTALVLPTDVPFSAAEYCRLIEDERATDGVFIGDTLGVPIAQELDRRPYRLDSLRLLIAGAAIISPTTKRRILAHLPWIEILDSMGSTETGLQAIARATKDGIGRTYTVLPGNDILDEHGGPVANGERGYLARTEHCALGYYGDPARSFECFRQRPEGPFTITGDLVQMQEDGTVLLLGREETCINTGGEKVFAQEVEQHLLEHPAVDDALVVGVPSPRWGNEVRALVVWGTAGSEEAAVTAQLRRELAAYKVPKRLLAVPAIRRSPTGKVDYGWARSVAATGGGS
ncbi:MAG TPA: AMP-binding protein [Acidimicrobiales bacterium]|nr:AMP-binding protein [Acidimicrobiales bacterium]